MKKITVLIILTAIIITAASCAAPKPQSPAPPVREQTETATVEIPPEKPENTTGPQTDPEILTIQKKIQNSDIDGAIEDSQNYLLKNPQSDEALTLNAYALILKNRPKLAILSLKRAVELNPENTRARQLAAVAYTHAGEYALAADTLNTLNRENPDNADTLTLLSQLAFMNADNETAHKHACKAQELEPRNPSAAFYCAQALFAVNNPDEIEKMENLFTKLADKPEYRQQALQKLGLIYETRKPDKEKACAVYTKLHAENPDNMNYKASKDFNCAP